MLIKSSIHDKKSNNNKVTTIVNANLSLSQWHGKPLNIVVNADIKKNQQQKITVNEVVHMEAYLNLSLNQTKNIALRLRSKNKQMFEPNLEKKLTEASHIFDKYFTYEKIELSYETVQVKKKIQQTIVHCTDIKNLIEKI